LCEPSLLDHGPARVDAGPDQCHDGGSTQLTATAPPGATVRLSWEGGEARPEVTLELPAGVHPITATATDGSWSDRDVVAV